MSGIKIHQYPLERFTFGDDDYYDIDYWDGAGYQTAKIKGSTIKDAIRSGILTIYSDNGSLTENRTVNIAGFNLAFTGGSIGMGDDLTVVSTDAAKPFVGNFINSNGDVVLYVANTGDNVGIGTSAPESDAKLDIESTSKGILIPRMTTTERGSITLATFNESMIIYNITTNQFEYIDSTLNWVPLGGGAEALDDLTDVTTGLPVTPTEADDGRLLFYDYDAGEWITDDTVNHGTVVINCKKSTAGTIAKGLPVYLVGFDSDLHTVELANASSTNTMPVIGFTAEPLNDTDSKHLTTFGKVTGLDTTSAVSTLNPNGETWAVNDSLYMSTTAGGLTRVRPTGPTTLIQRVAKILKVDATGGQIFVFNTARTAGLPNLGTDKLWLGDANGNPQEVDKSAIGGDNFANADLTLDADRTHNLNGNTLTIRDNASDNDEVFKLGELFTGAATNAFLGAQLDLSTDLIKFYSSTSTNSGGYQGGLGLASDNSPRLWGKSNISLGSGNQTLGVGTEIYINNSAQRVLFRNGGTTFVNLDANSNMYFLPSLGNGIGIGTATPVAKLTVNGDVILNGLNKIGSEDISLNGRTAVKGADTLSTSTAFEIYDGDTTPTKLFEVRNNGDLYTNGTQGLSNTYTFGGGGSGDIASMTFTNGILTAVTTVP